jgi:arylsulfatase A-like enzyme
MLRTFAAVGGLLAVRDAEAAAIPVPPERPNVLVILIDDHPFNLTSVGQPSPVATPNLQRLAERSTWFSNAYNDAPICAASRAALLTGVHSTRSGIYYNSHAYRRAPNFISKATTLPGLFQQHGYLTAGYGKIGHNTYVRDEISDFSIGHFKTLDNVKEGDVTYSNSDLLEHIVPGSRRSIPGKASTSWDWGMLPDEWDREDPTKLQQDTEQANRTIELLRARHEKPFFAICGFYRPHIPWIVPKRYFDRFPLESINLPAGYRADDLEDLPKPGRWIAANRNEHAEIVMAGMWKKCLQGLFAATAYVDDQIGRVLDALEASEYHQNTIVVFATDNGFHTGEKNHWLKFALWEQTCRVSFAISVPGLPAQRSTSPVSLIDLYPTLVELCRLSPPTTHELDGVNLVEILAGQRKDRGKPALSTYGQGNHSLRNDRFRYTRYRNGTEEFYDHQVDPYEWTNLANDPVYAPAKADLARWLPEIEAPDAYPPDINPLRNATWADEAFIDD